MRADQLDGSSAAAAGQLARHICRTSTPTSRPSQLGITLASLALGWVGEPAIALDRRAPGAQDPRRDRRTGAFGQPDDGVPRITVLHIVIGEQAPKSFAIRRPNRLPCGSRAAAPVLLDQFPGDLAAQPGRDRPAQDPRPQLRRGGGAVALGRGAPPALSSSEMQPVQAQREILDNVFELSLRNARQVMVLRADVTHVDLAPDRREPRDRPPERHTRFPLGERDLDNVIGLIHIKDLFRSTDRIADIASLRGRSGSSPRPRRSIACSKNAGRAAALVAVLDEYGGVSGIVTLENVLEEIVGEIQDEFDTDRPELTKRGEGSYTLSGSMPSSISKTSSGSSLPPATRTPSPASCSPSWAANPGLAIVSPSARRDSRSSKCRATGSARSVSSSARASRGPRPDRGRKTKFPKRHPSRWISSANSGFQDPDFTPPDRTTR